MAKTKDEAKAEGFKRGLAGKTGTAGFTQGWSDDKILGNARTEGFNEGKKKRAHWFTIHEEMLGAEERTLATGETILVAVTQRKGRGRSRGGALHRQLSMAIVRGRG